MFNLLLGSANFTPRGKHSRKVACMLGCCVCVCDKMGKGKSQIKIQDLPSSMTFMGILNTRGLQKFHRKMCVLKRPDIDIKLFWHLNELIFWFIFPQTSCNTLVLSGSSVFLMTTVLAFAVFIRISSQWTCAPRIVIQWVELKLLVIPASYLVELVWIPASSLPIQPPFPSAWESSRKWQQC